MKNIFFLFFLMINLYNMEEETIGENNSYQFLEILNNHKRQCFCMESRTFYDLKNDQSSDSMIEKIKKYLPQDKKGLFLIGEKKYNEDTLTITMDLSKANNPNATKIFGFLIQNIRLNPNEKPYRNIKITNTHEYHNWSNTTPLFKETNQIIKIKYYYHNGTPWGKRIEDLAEYKKATEKTIINSDCNHEEFIKGCEMISKNIDEVEYRSISTGHNPYNKTPKIIRTINSITTYKKEKKVDEMKLFKEILEINPECEVDENIYQDSISSIFEHKDYPEYRIKISEISGLRYNYTLTFSEVNPIDMYYEFVKKPKYNSGFREYPYSILEVDLVRYIGSERMIEKINANINNAFNTFFNHHIEILKSKKIHNNDKIAMAAYILTEEQEEAKVEILTIKTDLATGNATEEKATALQRLLHKMIINSTTHPFEIINITNAYEDQLHLKFSQPINFQTKLIKITHNKKNNSKETKIIDLDEIWSKKSEEDEKSEEIKIAKEMKEAPIVRGKKFYKKEETNDKITEYYLEHICETPIPFLDSLIKLDPKFQIIPIKETLDEYDYGNFNSERISLEEHRKLIKKHEEKKNDPFLRYAYEFIFKIPIANLKQFFKHKTYALLLIKSSYINQLSDSFQRDILNLLV